MAPQPARNMSHCVSQTSPCVPRKAPAASPPASAAHHSVNSYVALMPSTVNNDDREQPLARRERRRPDQQLADHDRRAEALHQVADAVVVVAREIEPVLHPEPERHACVRVVTTEDQDQAVDRDEPVRERRQRKATVRRDEQRRRNEHGQHFEPPRQAVVRPDAGDDERDRDCSQQRERESRAIRAAQAGSTPRLARMRSRMASKRGSDRRLSKSGSCSIHSRLPRPCWTAWSSISRASSMSPRIE